MTARTFEMLQKNFISNKCFWTFYCFEWKYYFLRLIHKVNNHFTVSLIKQIQFLGAKKSSDDTLIYCMVYVMGRGPGRSRPSSLFGWEWNWDRANQINVYMTAPQSPSNQWDKASAPVPLFARCPHSEGELIVLKVSDLYTWLSLVSRHPQSNCFFKWTSTIRPPPHPSFSKLKPNWLTGIQRQTANKASMISELSLVGRLK